MGIPLDAYRQVALQCIGRAVFFGSLAIFCVMIGIAFDPVACFRSGAAMTLIMSAILLFKSREAARRPPQHTEVWLYLDEGIRPRETHSRFAFAATMRETYGRFALGAFQVSIGFFVAALALQIAGVKPFIALPG